MQMLRVIAWYDFRSKFIFSFAVSNEHLYVSLFSKINTCVLEDPSSFINLNKT